VKRLALILAGALVPVTAGLPGSPLAGQSAGSPDTTMAAADTVYTTAPGSEVEVREWKVPWENTRPRDPYVAPDGRVWFVGQRADYLAYLEPGSGTMVRYPLDPGTGPHNLIVAEDGTVWYAGNRDRHIGALDPATGEITKYPMPNPDARDPHTLVFDGRGDIWFTVQGGNFIGKLDTGSGDVRLVEVPTDRARPYGIKVAADDRPWVVMVGTYKLATVDPETFELTEIDLPRTEANPRRIGLTSDGSVWYVDYSQGYLGRYEPETGEFEEWRAPAGQESRPYGMAVDAEDRVWFVETGIQPNRLVGFDTRTGELVARTPIPSGGGTVRHMYTHPPGGEIWFGADTNTVGRIRVP